MNRSDNPVMTTTKDPRWAAVVNRDKNADSHFVYAVKTTGIYCRASCPSRRAKVENIEFFTSNELAEQAGYRPCKRCHPTQISQNTLYIAKIVQVCRMLEQADKPLVLNELATHVGLSAGYFHRLFKSIIGLTPKAYACALLKKRVCRQLMQDISVTDAIFEAGYHSNGRFYATSNQVLGMTPTQYRMGGEKVILYFAVGESSLGAILVAQSDRGICAILLGDDPDLLVRDLQDKFPQANLIGGDKQFEQQVAQVIGFVEAPHRGLDLPLDIRGTAFQQRVWQALCEIPPGSTMSYAEVAAKIGVPKAFRAVAGACAANLLAVAIPCHRVVRNDGMISGYRWGVERKRELLRKEAQTQLKQPK